MKRIVIVGAGGMGREIWCLINAINEVSCQWEFVGFYDDAFHEPKHVIAGFECLGSISTLESEEEELAVAFGIANRETVQKIVHSLSRKANFHFPNLIHPNVALGFGFEMGQGNMIASSCEFSCEVTIGDFNFFNGLCVAGHDVEVANFNCFMPRVQISGDVKIGSHNFMGMGSSIVQEKKVGDNNTIMSHSFLTKSIGNERKYFGIPAKRVNI
jgi:sugar O-acyltransferase (sialic acid O-acetyltransferase NeuD family)